MRVHGCLTGGNSKHCGNQNQSCMSKCEGGGGGGGMSDCMSGGARSFTLMFFAGDLPAHLHPPSLR